MMNEVSPLKGRVPDASVVYCETLWRACGFELRIASPRKTRFGDFCVTPQNRLRISVNANLNPYHFLVTYLHEVAHCKVYLRYKTRVRPHGSEWKATFGDMLRSAVLLGAFPESIELAVRQYADNPKSSTARDSRLYEALCRFDLSTAETPSNKIRLQDLKDGQRFVFQERAFIRLALRRTRVLCIAVDSKRRYTILATALVELL